MDIVVATFETSDMSHVLVTIQAFKVLDIISQLHNPRGKKKPYIEHLIKKFPRGN